jgi:hypothetical protein
MNTAFNKVRANANLQTTATLCLALSAADQRRTSAVNRRDIDEAQALNMVISATLEVVIERLPELDAALDVWCAEMSDDRTMAQFVVDWCKMHTVSL